MSNEQTHHWPTADVIYVDRADVAGMETFEPGVYLLTYDPTSHSRDYCRAGTQLGQDPDLGDKILEGIDEIISWYEVTRRPCTPCSEWMPGLSRMEFSHEQGPLPLRERR